MREQQYLFSCVDADRSVQYGFKVDDETNHYYVVREFLQFLSSIYGYDLTEKYLDDSLSNT